MRIFRQFTAFCAIVWQNALAYRGENIVWLFIESTPIIIQISLWKSLYEAGRISVEMMQYMMLYYLLGLIISRTTGNHFEEWLVEHIRDGRISGDLIKPFSYQLYLLANEAVWRVSGVTYTVPMLLLLSPLFYSSLHTFSTTPGAFFLFCIVLLLAFIQRFFISWIISISAFWIEEAGVFTHIKWMLEGLLGGAWLPLTFFPTVFQNIAKLTPFYAWFTLPIGIILNTSTQQEIVWGISSACIWIILLFVASQVFWKKALIKYSASGG